MGVKERDRTHDDTATRIRRIREAFAETGKDASKDLLSGFDEFDEFDEIAP